MLFNGEDGVSLHVFFKMKIRINNFVTRYRLETIYYHSRQIYHLSSFSFFWIWKNFCLLSFHCLSANLQCNLCVARMCYFWLRKEIIHCVYSSNKSKPLQKSSGACLVIQYEIRKRLKMFELRLKLYLKSEIYNVIDSISFELINFFFFRCCRIWRLRIFQNTVEVSISSVNYQSNYNPAKN